MRVIRPGALILAGVISAPALWQGFVTHGTDEGTALVRYLIAVPVAAVMLAVFGWLADAYRPVEEEPPPKVTVSAERRRMGTQEPSAGTAASAERDDRTRGELPAAQDPVANPNP